LYAYLPSTLPPPPASHRHHTICLPCCLTFIFSALTLRGSSPDGVNIHFLLGAFADACGAAGVAWTEPKSNREWKQRLKSSARLAICQEDHDASIGGHVHVPALFGHGNGQFAGAPFRLVEVVVEGVLQGKGREVSEGLYTKFYFIRSFTSQLASAPRIDPAPVTATPSVTTITPTSISTASVV